MPDFLCSREPHSSHARFMGVWGVQPIAIGGSKIPLPNRRALLEKFGGTGRGASSPTALACPADGLLFILISIFAVCQSLIIQKTATAECFRYLFLLVSIWIYPVFICFEHLLSPLSILGFLCIYAASLPKHCQHCRQNIPLSKKYVPSRNVSAGNSDFFSKYDT